MFISGLFFAGPPYRISQAWRDERVQLVVCPEILAEYRQVASRLIQRYKSIDVSALIDLVAVRSRIIQARALAKPVCDDPSDDIFLACALAAKAPVIVSGDRHLLKASGFAGIQVLRPKTFVDAYL